jgi:hypothetical protein
MGISQSMPQEERSRMVQVWDWMLDAERRLNRLQPSPLRTEAVQCHLALSKEYYQWDARKGMQW